MNCCDVALGGDMMGVGFKCWENLDEFIGVTGCSPGTRFAAIEVDTQSYGWWSIAQQISSHAANTFRSKWNAAAFVQIISIDSLFGAPGGFSLEVEFSHILQNFLVKAADKLLILILPDLWQHEAADNNASDGEKLHENEGEVLSELLAVTADAEYLPAPSNGEEKRRVFATETFSAMRWLKAEIYKRKVQATNSDEFSAVVAIVSKESRAALDPLFDKNLSVGYGNASIWRADMAMIFRTMLERECCEMQKRGRKGRREEGVAICDDDAWCSTMAQFMSERMCVLNDMKGETSYYSSFVGILREFFMWLTRKCIGDLAEDSDRNNIRMARYLMPTESWLDDSSNVDRYSLLFERDDSGQWPLFNNDYDDRRNQAVVTTAGSCGRRNARRYKRRENLIHAAAEEHLRVIYNRMNFARYQWQSADGISNAEIPPALPATMQQYGDTCNQRPTATAGDTFRIISNFCPIHHPLLNPDYRFLLIYGPTGSGKSVLLHTLATALRRSIFSLQITNIIHSVVGLSQRYLRNTFEAAKLHSPSVLLIDDIDEIFGLRNDTDLQESQFYTEIQNTFAFLLDSYVTTHPATALNRLHNAATFHSIPSDSNDVKIIATTAQSPLLLPHTILARIHHCATLQPIQKSPI